MKRLTILFAAFAVAATGFAAPTVLHVNGKYKITIEEEVTVVPTPIASTTPVASASPTATPVVLTGVDPMPASAQLVPNNMERGTDGVWRSTTQRYLNSYLQARTDNPARWVKYHIRRQTNVIPMTTGLFVNDKIWRSWGTTIHDWYVGLGWSYVNGVAKSDGAYKITGENPTINLNWPSFVFVKDQWQDETYEWDYEHGTYTITIGSVVSSGKFTPAVDQNQFGPQCVIATDPAPLGYPSNAYVNFQFVSFEWR